MRILEYTSPANLDSLSQVAHCWYSLATKRLRKHREYRSKFRTLHDGYAWLDVLVNILQDPWIGHYVTRLSMNTKIRFRRGLLSDLNIPRHASGTPDQWRVVKEAFMESPFIDDQNSIGFDRQTRNCQEALLMALLITLLPNVQQLTMNVPATWKGIKVIQNVVTQMAIAYHRKCPTEGGLISLRNIEFKGHCHRGRGRRNLSFAAPFIALPEASTLKLVQIGSGQFTSNSDLPLSNISSLILVQSPCEPQALSALLYRTPWLERFIYLGAGFDLRTTLGALAANVGLSLKFLALDISRTYHFSELTIDKCDIDLPSLCTAYLFFSWMPNLGDLLLDEWSLKVSQNLILDGLQYSPTNVKFVKALVNSVHCKQIHLLPAFLEDCTSLDLEAIIEAELLKEACSQSGVTLIAKDPNFREKIVLEPDGAWRDFL
ncbi:hypothetical protein G7Y79_00056g090240 [Physcia stellaris]|nr:hypothetical protein G7Y79_00056g090240 [Physcia stellaris]